METNRAGKGEMMAEWYDRDDVWILWDLVMRAIDPNLKEVPDDFLEGTFHSDASAKDDKNTGAILTSLCSMACQLSQFSARVPDRSTRESGIVKTQI